MKDKKMDIKHTTDLKQNCFININPFIIRNN